MFKRLSWALLALAVVAMPTLVDAAGGSGGGGGGGGGGSAPKPFEARVTGYITAIDYANGVILVGQSYYGSGALKITSSTKISIDGANGTLEELQLNDWAECRYDYYTKIATKVSVGPSSP